VKMIKIKIKIKDEDKDDEDKDDKDNAAAIVRTSLAGSILRWDSGMATVRAGCCRQSSAAAESAVRPHRESASEERR
jgi:hypothetical protein